MNPKEDDPMSIHSNSSLLERLQAHQQEGYLSLHMPGHKENAKLASYLNMLNAPLDITELPGFDDLHDPSEVLARSMK
jgi:arginine/lysine/ornithine decarboxylase